MALLPNAPNCVSVAMVGTNQGQLWQNKIHFSTELGASLGIPTSAQLSTFCDAVAAAWTTNIAPLCNPLVLLTDINAIVLTDRTSPTFYSHDPTPPPGTNTGTALPLNMAVCISWHIDRRYRGGHGRIYVPAGNIDDVQGGRLLTSAFQIQCNSAADGFHTALQGLTVGSVPVQLVVLSYYESVPDPANPGKNMTVLRSQGTPFLVTSAKVRTRFDSQRRRLGKETS